MSATVLAPARLARPAPAAVLELLKPITWFAPMWAFMCGLVSSGQSASGHWLSIAGGVLLCGPLVCATSQAVNDWFDRHVDAINEPHRPIPSGRIPGRWGLGIAIVWTGLSLVMASLLGRWVLAPALLGMALAWAYSAPPLRLKREGWLGNTAVAISYEGLTWLTGAAVMTGGLPDWLVFVMAGLYSFGAHGIMTLNDFKSVDGDRAMGIRSLPAVLGIEGAARLACMMMAAPQAVVVTLLVLWGHPLFAAGVAVLLLAQFALMGRLMAAPREKAPWYNGTGTTLFVLGMLVAAFALQMGAGS